MPPEVVDILLNLRHTTPISGNNFLQVDSLGQDVLVYGNLYTPFSKREQ
jgi:hypothetical protein